MTSDRRSDETALLAAAGGPAAAMSGAPSDGANATTLRPDRAATHRATQTEPGDSMPPEIAGYRLLERLGEGGMGVVYKAEHLALRRLVAIKMIRSGALASSDELVRFQIEGEAVARLQHANIVQIFDVGQQQGLRYLSLEFVEGGTLAHQIGGRAQPPREAATMVALLARAVHAAHLRGIIHRDLKPHNVLVTTDGVPKISDFGLAKLAGDTSAAESYMMVGTAGYMAPEQAWGSGAANEIGPESDVYGLGVILYEMLAGRVPFVGSTPRETLEQVWAKDPPPLRHLRPNVPMDLETICLKCLEKLPHRRYASAEALADDLSRFLAGEPIHARQVGALERAVKWAQRRPAIASLAGVVLLAAAMLIAVATWYQIRVNANYRRAKSNLEQAQNAIDQLINRVSVEGLSPIPQTEGLRRNLLETALDLCQKLQLANPDDPDLAWQTARAQRQAADLYQLLGQTQRAKDAYRQSAADFAALIETDPAPRNRRELAVTWNNLGNLYAARGQVAAAIGALEESASLWEKLAAESLDENRLQQGRAAAQNNLGLARLAAGETEKAVAALQTALTIREKLAAAQPTNTDYPLELAATLSNLADIDRRRGERALAQERLRRALDTTQELAATPESRYIRASLANNLGATLIGNEESETAIAICREAVTGFEMLAEQYPGILQYQRGLADALSNLGGALMAHGEWDEAERQLARSKSEFDQLIAKSGTMTNRLGMMSTLQRQTQLAREQERDQDAQELSLAAARLGESLVAEAPDNLAAAEAQAVALLTLSELLTERQRHGEAQRQLTDALALAQRVQARATTSATTTTLRRILRQLGATALENGDPEQAADAAEQLAALTGGADETFAAAQLLAQCIPLATGLKGSKGNQAAADLESRWASRAAVLLEGLRQQGKLSEEQLKEAAFSAFRERPEGRALLQAP